MEALGLPLDWEVRRFGEKLSALRPGLLRFARSRTLQRADAEDVVSEVTLKLLQKYAEGRWHDVDNFDAYVFGAVRKKCLDWVRQQGRLTKLIDRIIAERIVSDDASRAPERSDDYRRLRDALQSLPEELSAVVVCIDFLGYTLMETADMLSCPSSTLWDRLQRARSMLRRAIEASDD